MGQTAELPFSFQHLSLPGGMRAAMKRNPDKIAAKHDDTERSYAELVERFDRVSSGILDDLGMASGQHAAIISKNSIEYVEVVLGASQAGVGIATINPKLAPPELVAICDDAEAVVVFADADVAPVLREQNFATVQTIIEIGKEYEDWLARQEPIAEPPLVDEWSTFTIPYTSGTTGKPKGVLVTHRSRVIALYQMAVEYGCFGPDDRFLAIAPICHGAGMAFVLAPIFFGGYVEITDKFDPEDTVRRFKESEITGFFGVPTHFNIIFTLEQAVLDKYRSETLHTIISNAAPLPQKMKEKIIAHFGQILHECYGSTECGFVSNLRTADQLRKSACVGQPFPGTLVEIRNQDGAECAPEEVGELFVKGPSLFNGYWKRPDETAAAWSDGWVTVGDLAKKDSEGHVYIVDRIKDMVITGGINVYPREIEETLIRHPEIADVAVIGVPDEKWGEKLKAFVVRAPGSELGDEAVVEYCDGKISSMKTPKEVVFIDVIPRNASGKILKTDLREL
jgi:long-chain acyl-CoA synthetase